MKISRYFKFALLLSALFVSLSAQAQFWKKTNQLLKEDDAFKVSAVINEGGSLSVNWSIAQDYYMYRDQFSIESLTPGIEIGEINFPKGEIEDDPEFGKVEVYFYDAILTAGTKVSSSDVEGSLQLLVKGQGCNKPVGVCYPPLKRNIAVDNVANLVTIEEGVDAVLSAEIVDKSRTATPLQKPNAGVQSNFLSLVLSAFFAGILLSFTPCVLPMIPILAGVIAGQKNISKARSGWLAICYVLGTVVTYIIAGALAGATGAQLQAYFQSPWVISAICVLLLILAASLFGLFRIELPSSIQTRLSASGDNSNSVAISSFSLGLVSALVVGACVSPVLILALGAAITQGDPVLGAAIMGSMALGMGLLLIAFGFGAGWLLPRSGPWMTQIQVLFGFMVLGVAIYLLGGLQSVPVLFLWAGLLFVTGFYLLQLAASEGLSALIASVIKSLGFVCVLWGSLALVGGTQSGRDILQPLEALSFSASGGGSSLEKKLPFNVVTNLPETEKLMREAKKNKQSVLIDFYADWCLDCKRMDRTTFKKPAVQAALANWQLIKIDVTETSAISEAVKRHFSVFGPPATLFFNADGNEAAELRQYGYIEETQFVDLIRATK